MFSYRTSKKQIVMHFINFPSTFWTILLLFIWITSNFQARYHKFSCSILVYPIYDFSFDIEYILYYVEFYLTCVDCHDQVFRHERRPSQLTALNEMPLYPTEEIIWDENIVPLEYVSGDGKWTSCTSVVRRNMYKVQNDWCFWYYVIISVYLYFLFVTSW